MFGTFKEHVVELYTGTNLRSLVFRYALIAFDVFSIILFIAVSPLQETSQIEYIVSIVGLVILTDFIIRLWIARDRLALMRRVYVIADFVVIFDILISAFIDQDIAFLRVLRGLRLVHCYHLLNDLRHVSRFFQRHEQIFISVLNLFVFVFFTTSLVFTFFVGKSTGFNGYVDALYFTIATLTTTGYGDLTPTTIPNKLLAVGIMIVGVTLFVQVARAIFVPSKKLSKISIECHNCSLLQHDVDAVHCKHCGNLLKIAM
ncbi:MAG TPA: ion transporter [Rhodobacteraceae bacterium]|nr:potassium channel family protein [Alphaproteobacteria bacterium]HAB37836.1 ion transporter [Paracoccaceae bacterium]HAQ48579.1 ion transporter [Glaciecola sp.]